ncbi:MAG: InlB B-repeat-containing protein, partial [Paludibacteraceae bacterium]|nr:InlB B-repeat-containing protein [Paludibacteraceae bacterium]
MKNKFNFKSIILTLTLLTLGVGQMWAWQAHGTFNSWGAGNMTQSSANSAVYYYQVSGTGLQFKITGDSGWGDNEKGSGDVNNDYGNVSLGGSGNISGGVSGTWYICYHSGDGKVYGTTTNPNYPDMVIAGNNFGSPAIGDWSTTATVMSSNGSGTYTKTITNVAASDCQFKIAYKGTWTGAKGYDSKKVTGTNCSSGPSDASGNISFTPAVAGSVTITYVQSTGAITITCPTVSYSVTYDGNGKTSGSVPTDASSPYSSGATVTVKGNTGNLAKTGCVFDGWMTAQDGSGTTYAPGATFSITGPTTLYARWIAKTIYVYDNLSWGSMKVYTFESNRNGSWSGTNATSLGSSWYQVDLLDGAGKFILNNGSGTQTEDITIASYNPSITEGHSYEIYDDSGTKKLREKKLEVSFNMKSHGSAVSSQNIYYNGLVTEPSPAPSATGYTFGGWYKETGCSNAWNFSTDKVTADKTLYAKWTAKTYNGTIDKNGGAADKSYTATYDATSLTISSAPSRTGYILAGYYEEAECTHLIANTSKALQASTSYTTSASKWNYTSSAPKLYAGWTAKTYSITLHDNNGGSNNGSATATYDGSLSSITRPTKSGYHVVGYYKEAGLTNKIANSDGSLCASTDYTDASSHWTYDGTRTLYAKWEEDVSDYTLTFGVHSSGHGTLAAKNTSTSAAISSGSSITTNTGITMTASPSSYYEVEGWYNSSACTAAIGGWGTTNPKSFTLDNNYTVYVKFQTITYNISYTLNGGTNSGSNPATYTYETATITLQTPTRSGYIFAGWYSESTFENKVTTIPNHSSGAKNLYAKWVPEAPSAALLAGNFPEFDSWNKCGTMTKSTSGSVTTFTYTLYDVAAGTYEFCLKPSGGCGESTAILKPAQNYVVTQTQTGCTSFGESGDENHNFKVVTGSAGDITITVTYNSSTPSVNVDVTRVDIATSSSGWYMIGDTPPFKGWGTNTECPINRSYRGMSNVYYRVANFPNEDKYFKLSDGTTEKGTSNTSSDTEIEKKTQYAIVTNTSKAFKITDGGLVFCVFDKTNTKFWIQDPQTYYSVNVTNEGSGSKGTYKVTLNSSSVAPSGLVGKEMTKFANGETFKITVTGVTGYIPTITIGSTPTTFNKEATTYEATGTMGTGDVAVTISYTASYTVELEVGTIKGNKHDPKIYLGSTDSEGNVVASGTKVKSGTKVIYWISNDKDNVVKNAHYTWWGFRDAPAGTDPTHYTDDRVSVYTVNALSESMHVYAVFGETNYWITPATTGQGSIDPEGANAHVQTATTFTANPSHGWKFYNWTIPANVTAYGAYTANSNPILINATAAATLTANFQPRWAVQGLDQDPWNPDDYQIDDTYYQEDGDWKGNIEISLAANTEYRFQIYDRKDGDSYGVPSAQSYDWIHYAESNDELALTKASGYKDLHLVTGAAGTYTFKWNETDKAIAVEYPTSWWITTGQSDASGGSFTAVDNSSNNVKGGKFVANGASVTFEATPNTGYNFDGWYTDEDCTEGKNTSNPMTISSITANKTIYAKFVPETYTVTLTRSGTGYGSGGSGSVTATYNATLPAATLPTAAN